jgi:biopolymer transport protein ExbB
MSRFYEVTQALRAFLEAGGPVLWVIGAVAAFMGFVIIERYWYIYLIFPAARSDYLARWRQRPRLSVWQTHRLRQSMIEGAQAHLQRFLPLLKNLVALCPLLGLLGTVTGMIQVFDVVAALGTGNARAMASGISRATIPTMSGLVVALPGLYFSLQLEQLTRRKAEQLGDQLRAPKKRALA